jgi:GTP-binding protein LepA
METGKVYEVIDLGVNTPTRKSLKELTVGDVGWIDASIKTIDSVKVGDTITTLSHEAKNPLPGYKPMKPMVYSGLFPIEPNKFDALK